jgi:hypothetical protein
MGKRVQPRQVAERAAVRVARGVAAQVAAFILNRSFETGFHFIGSRVETRRFQALWVKLDSSCTAPPTVVYRLS